MTRMFYFGALKRLWKAVCIIARDYWPHVDRAINCGAHLETFRVRPCTVPCQLEPSPTFPRGSSQVATQNQNLLRARRSEYSRVSDFSTILDRSGAHVRRIAHHNACSGSLSIIVLIVRGSGPRLTKVS